ncbi:MAG: hypothetical protein ABEH58_09715, partial [Haloplanus sp.]
QDWDVARHNFYAAARDGFDADIRWITNDGQKTTDTAVVYDDLLSHAVDGLRSVGLSTQAAERYVDPLARRVERETTPAAWKRALVRARLDAGDDLAGAIHAMQRAYIGEQEETLLEGSFTDWLE